MSNIFSWRRGIATFAFSMALVGSHASSLSSTYDSVLSATQSIIESPKRQTSDLEEQVVQVASTFANVAGSDGTTIFPAGTLVDRAQISAGTLSLYVTFPAGTAKGTLKDVQVYPGSEILRHYFAEAAQLNAIHMFAKAAGEQDYVPVDDFIAVDSPPSVGPRETVIDYEIGGPGPQPDVDMEPIYERIRQENSGMFTRDVPGQGNASSSGLPQGALAGRIIFTYGGHGRTWDGSKWIWQRGYSQGMLEDFGNQDASDYYANYCFNAGATVVSFRPIGYQDNEVVLDNTSPGVTRTGTWNNSTNARYYGSGTPNYHWADSNNAETATATYTPNIPEAGYYPVYTWANYGSDRIPGGQLYRIRSTGGESLVRIDHRRIGCGWVYLGTYYFNAGSNAATGSVVISNQNPPGVSGSSYVAVADAIRFGNGMGDVSNGGGISGYSRREESTVYWIQNGWGNGNSAGEWTAAQVWNNPNNENDQNLSWTAVPRMVSQMLRLHAGDSNKQYGLHIGWHSNAANGSARGSMGLITGSPTTNQAWWAAKTSDELDAASLQEQSNWEHNWYDRPSATYTGAYGEITNSNFRNKVDATIIETAFHDNVQDAQLMRDPKVRSIHARGVYHAAVKYFNNFQGGPLAFSPERPVRFRAVNNGDGSVTLGWGAGLTGGTRGQAATAYRVYRSPDGLGWGAGETVSAVNHTILGLTPGETYYFRVAALNAGGESFPTETLAVRVQTETNKVLIVNGFDRLDRFNNVLRPAGLSGTPEQLVPQRNNTYNYVRQHATALVAAGRHFDSTSNEAVIAGNIELTNYETVIWMLGEESTADKTFDLTERQKVQAFLNGGGNLFVSGSDTGYELDGQNVDRTFYRTNLRAQYVANSASAYTADGVPGSIFEGITGINFAPTSNMYDADSCDVITPTGGSSAALSYRNPPYESFDSIAGWNQPSASGTTTAKDSTFASVTSPRREGTGAARLAYNWAQGNIVRVYSSSKPNIANTSKISIWVYGDNSGHSLRFFVRDPVDTELFQSPVQIINWTGWKEIVWDLATAPLSRFFGSGDGVMSGPVRLDSIYLTKTGASMTGNIYFDDVTVSVPATTKTGAVQYAGAYKLVNMAIPFETIWDESQRNLMMQNIMTFFDGASAVDDWSIY